MSWLMSNFAAISGAVVTLISVGISLMKFLTENSTSSRRIKRLSDLGDLYSKVSKDLSAREAIGNILKIEANKIEYILTRRVNIPNVAAVIVVSLVGGIFSYLLVLWATNSWILWSVIAWILFVIVAILTIGIAIAGFASVYEPNKDKG